jgi:hypothetical protein
MNLGGVLVPELHSSILSIDVQNTSFASLSS